MSEILTLRLKKFREKLGISQAEMAMRLGIQAVRYNYYEAGKRNPKNDFYETFKTTFGVDLLLTNDIDFKNKSELQEPKATKQKFCFLLFGHNIIYTGENIRTHYLHPMFSFKTQDIKGFELISYNEKTPENGGLNNLWTRWEDIRTLKELFELFAA